MAAAAPKSKERGHQLGASRSSDASLNAMPCLYIHPDLQIELKIGPAFGWCWDDSDANVPAAPRTAEILGPPEALRLIERLQLKSTDVNEAHTILLGPPSKLKMSAADRQRARIPPEAETYSFAYPARDGNGAAASKLMSELVGSVYRQLEPQLMFLLMGGFVYFSGSGGSKSSSDDHGSTDSPIDDRIVGINGLSFAPSNSGVLFFDGPFEAPTPTLPAMEALERMQPVSLHQLLGEGVVEIGWLNSAEGGTLLGQPAQQKQRHNDRVHNDRVATAVAPSAAPSVAPWTTGAILCKLENGTSAYFTVHPHSVRPRKHPSGLLRAVALLESHYHAADAASRRLESDLLAFYQSAAEKWLRFFGLLIPAYFGLGIFLYRYFEGWATLDAAYFLTVTVTTVGYGDFAPSTPSGRLLTSFYAPLGTVVVMTGLAQPVHYLLQRAMRHMTMCANRIERLVLTAARGDCGALLCAVLSCFCCVRGLRELDANDRYVSLTSAAPGWGGVSSGPAADRRKVRLGIVGQYVHAVLGPLICMAIGGTAGYFVHGWSALDSLYWAVVSITTVGFGDLAPSRDLEKVFAIAFLPIATAALISGVSLVQRASLRIGIIDANYKLVADRLLIDSAGDDPDATISREQFLLQVLTERGLIDDEVRQAIDRQYDEMLREYNDSQFGAKEPKEEIDPRVVFYHLKQQGRIITDTFNAGRSTRLLPVEAATPSSPLRYRYRVGEIKSHRGLDSEEGYDLWRQGTWLEAVRGEKAVAKIDGAMRGKLTRSRASPPAGRGTGASQQPPAGPIAATMC